VVLISCKGLDRAHGVTESNEEEAAVKQVMLQQSRKALLLADSSKFDKTAVVKTCELRDINTIVTDKEPANNWGDTLAQQQVKLVY
jgi:DeoR/GlpR family transcriptional regulator of sugar metabolism